MHVPHPLVVSPFAVFVQAVVGVEECQGDQKFGVVVVLADVFVVFDDVSVGGGVIGWGEGCAAVFGG